MALIKIKTAYQCEFCGRLFLDNHNFHEIECRYNPRACNCLTCKYNNERICGDSNVGSNVSYCPRNKSIFKYPHSNYCPDYVRDNNYEHKKD